MWARSAWGAKLQEALRVVRRVAGMPDYAAHVAHIRRCHPERAVPTAREFYEEYLRARYEDGPTRCC